MKAFLPHVPPFFYQEPFRIFFPTGLLLGMIGVALWPAYYAGWISVYPSISHARLMIEGFMGSFIIGFLGTAGPRITSTASFSGKAVLSLLTLLLLAAGLHFGGTNRSGDFLFTFCIATLLFLIGKRFIRRKDSPPPNFALVALGLLNGLAGAILLGLFENQLYAKCYRLGAMFLEQGFVLLPILGIAPFLLPKLLNMSVPEAPESRAFPPGWRPRAAFAVAIGLIVDLTFVADAFRLTVLGPWLRFGAILIYLIAILPSGARSFLADCLRIGIAAIVIGIGWRSALAAVSSRRSSYYLYQRFWIYCRDCWYSRGVRSQRERTFIQKAPAVFSCRGCADFSGRLFPLRRRPRAASAHHSSRRRGNFLDPWCRDLGDQSSPEGADRRTGGVTYRHGFTTAREAGKRAMRHSIANPFLFANTRF